MSKAPAAKAPKKPASKPVAEKKETPSQRLAKIGIEAICAHVASGESLLSWTKAHSFNYLTVLNWIEGDRVRAENYARAREARAEIAFESLDDVSEEAAGAETAVQVAGLRLKADNIKWKLARMAPKKYGDRIQNEHYGPDGGNIPVSFAVSFVPSGK